MKPYMLQTLQILALEVLEELKNIESPVSFKYKIFGP
jgi:hypothetical protein